MRQPRTNPGRQKFHPNQRRWLRPPSQELIRKVLSESGVNRMLFERFHGMYGRSLFFALLPKDDINYRDVPAKFWHIFYEAEKEKELPEQKIQELPAPKEIQVKDPSLLSLL